MLIRDQGKIEEAIQLVPTPQAVLSEGIAETVDLAQIKRHYYHSQHWVNPSGVVPVGPRIDFLSDS